MPELSDFSAPRSVEKDKYSRFDSQHKAMYRQSYRKFSEASQKWKEEGYDTAEKVESTQKSYMHKLKLIE